MQNMQTPLPEAVKIGVVQELEVDVAGVIQTLRKLGEQFHHNTAFGLAAQGLQLQYEAFALHESGQRQTSLFESKLALASAATDRCAHHCNAGGTDKNLEKLGSALLNLQSGIDDLIVGKSHIQSRGLGLFISDIWKSFPNT